MQSAKTKPAMEPIEIPAKASRPDGGQEIGYPSGPRPAETLLTPLEVAQRLGVSQRWVRDHATRRWPRITAVKLGSLLRFRWADVEDFLAHHTIQGPSKKDVGSV